MNNSTVASKSSSERKSHTNLTLNQKLEKIKFSEEGMSKAKTDQNPGLLCQMVSQVVNAKEKFLKLKVLPQWTHEWLKKKKRKKKKSGTALLLIWGKF